MNRSVSLATRTYKMLSHRTQGRTKQLGKQQLEKAEGSDQKS